MTCLRASVSVSHISAFLCTHLCFLFLALFSLSLCSAQGGLSSVAIYSASGCTDVSNVTVNCTFPAVITLETTGFGALHMSSQWVVVSSPGAQLTSLVRFVGGPNLNDSLTFTVQPQGYTPSLIGGMLSIQLVNYAGNASQPFAGMSLAPIAAPVLQSISGCSGSGSATLGCQPNATTLTLTGQGLMWLAGGSYQLCVGSGCAYVYGGGANGTGIVRVLNDSNAVVALSRLYIESSMLQPAHYGGGLLPIYFSLPVWNYWRESDAAPYVLNSLQVSFVPLPPPSVSSFYARRCNGTGTSTTPPFTGCIPLSSTLVLNGNYLYGSQVSVGGVPCISSSNAVTTICLVPIVPAYVPGQYYDVQLVNAAGSVSLPALLSFVGGPVLTGATQCIDYGVGLRQTGGGCQPGTLIAVFGIGFYPDASLHIVFTRPNSPYNFSCLQPAFVNSTALSCTLPSASSSNNLTLFLGLDLSLQLFFNNTAVLSNAVSVQVLDWPDPPLVSSVSGSCAASNGALAVSGCVMGSALTLYGSNLNGSNVDVYSSSDVVQNGVSLGFTYFDCVLQSVSASAISFLLPAPGDEFRGSLVPNVSYPFTATLRDSMGRYRRINAFTVAFAAAAPTLPSSTGSDSGAGGGNNISVILIGVLVPVLMLLLLLVSVLLWRRWVMTKRAGRGNTGRTDDDRFEHFTDDVEMR